MLEILSGYEKILSLGTRWHADTLVGRLGATGILANLGEGAAAKTKVRYEEAAA
jgi:hypothetical protein